MRDEQYILSLFEVCEILSRSKRSVSRYVRRGFLHPIKVKSRLGTLEYRFSQDDVDNFKAIHQTRQDETGQDRQDRTRQDVPSAIEDRTEDILDETEIMIDADDEQDVGTDKIEETAVYEDIPDQDEINTDDIEPVIRPDETGQDKTYHRPLKTRQDETGQDTTVNSKIINILEKELDQKNKQLAVKDEQIKNLTERVKEDNYLILGFQNELKLLKQGSEGSERQEKPTKPAKEDVIELVPKKKQGKKKKTEPHPKKSWWRL